MPITDEGIALCEGIPSQGHGRGAGVPTGWYSSHRSTRLAFPSHPCCIPLSFMFQSTLNKRSHGYLCQVLELATAELLQCAVLLMYC